MRIIGGQFKGKKILEPKDKKTRPLKDMVRESIINILIHSNKFSINLKETKISWNNKKSLSIVLCSNGYPDEYKKNILISNLEKIKQDQDNLCFHAVITDVALLV